MTLVVPGVGLVHPDEVWPFVLQIPHRVEGGGWRSKQSGYIGVEVEVLGCLDMIGQVVFVFWINGFWDGRIFFFFFVVLFVLLEGWT